MTQTQTHIRRLYRAIAVEKSKRAAAAEAAAKEAAEAAAELAAAKEMEAAAAAMAETTPSRGRKAHATRCAQRVQELEQRAARKLAASQQAADWSKLAARDVVGGAAAAWLLATTPEGERRPLVHGSGIGQDWSTMAALLHDGRLGYFNSTTGVLTETDAVFPACLRRGVELAPATTYSPQGGDTITQISAPWRTIAVNAAPRSILPAQPAKVTRRVGGWPTCYGASGEVPEGAETAPILRTYVGCAIPAERAEEMARHIRSAIGHSYGLLAVDVRWAYYTSVRDLTVTVQRGSRAEELLPNIRHYCERARARAILQRAAEYIAAQAAQDALEDRVRWYESRGLDGLDTHEVMAGLSRAAPRSMAVHAKAISAIVAALP